MSGLLLDLNQNLTSPYVEGQKYIEFHGVQITPPFIEFKDAFEGRTYKQNITIQNVSLSRVSVRITQPTSYAYKIKCIRNHNLSAGLRLVREVSYVHSHTNTPRCIIGIYINQNRLDYQLFANATRTTITLIPTYIDFGLVDTAVTSKTHVIVIRNDGVKTARFFIDSKSRQQLIVYPNKGFLQPKSSIKINIKLISTNEGPICDPIWVKCEKPYMISTMGNVIKPKFETILSGLSTTFTLLDFPVTYIGISSTKTVYVRNYSSCRAMFCLMGEMDGKLIDIKTRQGMVQDFQQFDVTPKDGVCESREVMVFHFKFTPQQPEQNKKIKSYYFCIYNVCRIRCKYLSPSLYEDEVFTEHDVYGRQNSQTWSASMNFDINKEVDASVLISSVMESYCEQVEARQERDCVKFYAHGIAEKPSVTVVPDELSIVDIEVGRREVRVLELKNCSDILPIIIVYKKVAYVDVERNNITLDAMESVQMSVFVTPQKIGVVKSQIRFDLVYYDQPKTSDHYKVIGKVVVPITFEGKSVTSLPLPQINNGLTPNYVNEIGKFCENISFNDPTEKPRAAVISNAVLKKDSLALIAFPNDMQRSLRPWRDKPIIKTIFTRVPRYVAPLNSVYELTPFEKKFKMLHDDYYTAYTRRKATALQQAREIPVKTVSEYDMTDTHKLMTKDTFDSKLRCERAVKIKKDEFFIPLTPREMNNILIKPMVIHTNQMAAHSRYAFKVKIENTNISAIRIFIRPESSNIYFVEGNRRTIEANSCISVSAVFISSSVGYYTTSLDVIVNECGVFVVTLIADICQTTLHLSKELIEFTETEVISMTREQN